MTDRHPQTKSRATPFVAIACGGTGGHFFPGIAIARALQERGCETALLISNKDVDQQIAAGCPDLQTLSLPAVACQNGELFGFAAGCWNSWKVCVRFFRQRKPQAVLAMGGFTSAPPVLAAKFFGSAVCLHEANSIPGRANRWLAPMADRVFVGFRKASRSLLHQSVWVTGTPVRSEFSPLDPAACRMSLGLEANRPVLLIVGGSQGASAINDLLVRALPGLVKRAPDLQFVHLTGGADHAKVSAAYRAYQRRSVVLPFLTEMELALGAATLAVSRAGASSLSEFASMQLPSILVPYPAAADNHQFYNARTFAEAGAAHLLDQQAATPEILTDLILGLVQNHNNCDAMKAALARCHFPNAAQTIAQSMLDLILERSCANSNWNSPHPSCGHPPHEPGRDAFHRVRAFDARDSGRGGVAQIFNLLYRGIVSCRAATTSGALEIVNALPITNRRYGRLKVCATLVQQQPQALTAYGWGEASHFESCLE